MRVQMFLTMGKNGCGVYFFFASMMLCSFVFVVFLVPETKGKILMSKTLPYLRDLTL